MFICRDASQRYLLAVYWEDKHLLIVVKEMTAARDLVEHAAFSFPVSEAEELTNALTAGPISFRDVEIDALTAKAIAGQIAEGLKKTQKRTKATGHSSRISPESWN